MDLYVLDELLRRIEVVDQYESLIWTERFAQMGDFQVVIRSTIAHRYLLRKNTRLAINESKRVMVVETIVDKVDAEGRSMLTVSGRSLECILLDRIVRNNLKSLTASPRWLLEGTPGDIARQIFDNICVHGMLDKRDIIPFITPGSIFPPDTIQEPHDEYVMEFEPSTVYDAIKEICTTHGLGFALVRDADTSRLHFIVYAGSNRTLMQKSLTPVIFSPELDTLTNVSELESVENYKNVAYVFSPEATAVVYADEADPEMAGFERRLLMVKVDSITPTDEEAGLTVSEILQKRGRDALAEHRELNAFDGEVPTFGHKYDVDYSLGDVAEMRNAQGDSKYMRVTEQIFVSDSEGVRSYPTLTIDLFITPGSWDAVDATLEWEDAEGEWEDA